MSEMEKENFKQRKATVKGSEVRKGCLINEQKKGRVTAG